MSRLSLLTTSIYPYEYITASFFDKNFFECAPCTKEKPHFGEGLKVGNVLEDYAQREQIGDFVRFRAIAGNAIEMDGFGDCEA